MKNVKYTNSHCFACAEDINILMVSIPMISRSVFHMNMFFFLNFGAPCAISRGYHTPDPLMKFPKVLFLILDEV